MAEVTLRISALQSDIWGDISEICEAKRDITAQVTRGSSDWSTFLSAVCSDSPKNLYHV